MKHVIDPDGQRLPIKIDTTSNEAFAPVPLTVANHTENRLAHAAAIANANRLGVSRRDFLISACGMASALVGVERGQCGSGETRRILQPRT